MDIENKHEEQDIVITLLREGSAISINAANEITFLRNQAQAEKAELVRQCADIVKRYESYPRQNRFELINFAILSLIPKDE